MEYYVATCHIAGTTLHLVLQHKMSIIYKHFCCGVDIDMNIMQQLYIIM